MEIEINIPDGRIGLWEIQTFSLSAHEAEVHNMMERTGGKRYIHCNKHYKRLLRYDSPGHSFGKLIMSNTPAEVEDHRRFIEIASGDILVFGLGLGMVIQALIEKGNITSITVIEISQDVISLCGSHYVSLSPKVKILQADAFCYYTDQRYGAIWFDIWDHICALNLIEMVMLKRRWRRNSPIRMCWAEKECRVQSRAEKGMMSALALPQRKINPRMQALCQLNSLSKNPSENNERKK